MEEEWTTFQEVTEVLSVEKEIGERLRQARESMGLSLDQLQEKTKIQKSFITAIENGEFNKLPSPFYVRTYLRTYCKCVKIEPHHILRQYRKAEQAERGLTTTQQVITPEMLAQAQQMYQNGNFNQNIGNLNLQNTVIGQSIQNTMMGQPLPRVSRTNAHTALTIAKKHPQNQQDRYSKKQDPIRSSATTSQPILEQTRIGTSLDKTKSLEQTQVRASLDQTQMHQAKTKKAQNPVRKNATNNASNSKKSIDEKTTRRTAGSSYTPTRRLKAKKEATTQSTIPDRNQLTPDLNSQGVSQMRQLSRSAVRGSRRSARSGGFRWSDKKTLLIIIASIVICIPLVWATVAAVFGDDEEEKQTSQEDVTTKEETTDNNDTLVETTEDESTEEEDSSEDQGEVVPTDNNTYEVSGSQLKIQFRANEQSWVQVRNQAEIQKQGYLKDATLQSGDSDQYIHDFSKGNEVWISIGIPEAVTVIINGKTIDSAKTIHIKKK